MKKIFLLIAAAFVATSVSAQMNPMAPIPADSALRMGKLPNGMTYYIRHNEKPKGQADFYIFDNVGAIQEDENQRGLAHFLEHMAFNGTKNLPDKQLTEWLETVGVKFGANLNAYTAWDETCYNIDDVPTARPSVIDSALLILHDWSHFISLKPDEIDKERGVIQGELRQRDGGSWRSQTAMMEALGKGSPYEHNNLIGYLDYLQSFKYDQLVDFYNQWYRPDNQSIVVVGDIDVNAVEAKIKSLMSDIPAPGADASVREPVMIPDNDAPIVSVFSDPEMPASRVTIFIKREATPKEVNGAMAGEMINVMESYMSAMENARLQEISMKPDAPFMMAGMESGGLGMIPTIESNSFIAVTQDGKLADGFKALYTELEKVRRFGFTESEFERAQNDLMRQAEQTYTNRNDRTNNSFVQVYLNNFRKNAPMPDAQTAWQLDSMLIKAINVQAVNQFAQHSIYPNNQVIYLTSPQREGVTVPTVDEILAIRDEVTKADLEPYADTTVKEPLIPEDAVLNGSPVKTTTENATFGTTEWTLANGVKIIVKPTTFKADEVQMNAKSKGGLSLLSDDDYYMGENIGTIASYEGVGKFSSTELQKQLSGKSAAVSVNASDYQSAMVAKGSPKDLETMLQLVYLNFTQPRFDENDYNALMKIYGAQLENLKTNPDYLFQQKFMDVLYGNNPRHHVISKEIADKFDFKALPTIYKTLFPDANSFTFTFVGNVDLNVLKPLVEKYIGSIQTSKQPTTWVDDKSRPAKGAVNVDFNVAMQQPKVSVFYGYTGEMPYTFKNKVALSYLVQALNSRYLESIREDKGGSYGVQVQGQSSFFPVQDYTMLVVFDTNVAQADEMCGIIGQEIQNIADNGPKSEDIDKAREYMLKNWPDELEQNSQWMKFLQENEFSGLNYMTDYEAALKSVTNADVQAMAKKLLADGNVVKVVMHPASTVTATTEADAAEAAATPAAQQAK